MLIGSKCGQEGKGVKKSEKFADIITESSKIGFGRFGTHNNVRAEEVRVEFSLSVGPDVKSSAL